MKYCSNLIELQTVGSARVYRCKVQLACGQFGHLIKDFFSYPKFPKAKSQRSKDVPLGGARDSALFHRMRKEAILLLHKQEKHLANIVKTLNYI
jgi:hypothetical protein